MKPIVQLKDVIDGLDLCGDEFKSFLNIRTGEVITFSDDELMAVDMDKDLDGYPEWQREQIQKANDIFLTDDYRELPGKFEIHEYSIMEKFCYSVEDDDTREQLITSIRGRGAFRYFKGTIHRYGIVDDWYQYRNQAFRRIAINWLEDNNIAYTEESK